jgi:hypothetical protein
VNDDAHYASQAFLGWSVAYLACSAVNKTEDDRKEVRFAPIPLPDGAGVGIIFEH